MKFTINVDCTPEEARRFFGLPDLDQMNEAMQENMKIWAPQNMQHFQELQQMIWDQMGAAMTMGQSAPEEKKNKNG
jgi:hypothetical protein